jgi:hypothetical protein
MNSRHANLSLFLCVQFVTSVPPVIRAQADIVIALRESIKSNQKRLHEYFFGIFPTLKDFQRVLMKATENFGALIVNNRATSASPSRCVFTYRAEAEQPVEKLCCARVWKVARAVTLAKKVHELQKRLEREEAVRRGAVLM